MDLFPPGMVPGGGEEEGPPAGGASGSSEGGRIADITDRVDSQGCYARNERAGFPMSNLFVGDSVLGCKSDADEQLILHVAFKEFVKIKSIKFIEFNQGLEPENNPTKVHLYVNRENLGFEDCEDVDPTQTLHLTSEDLKEGADPIPLKFVRYQRVTSLTLFVEDNQGGEFTALGGIKFYGQTVNQTNMADFKKKPEGMM